MRKRINENYLEFHSKIFSVLNLIHNYIARHDNVSNNMKR